MHATFRLVASPASPSGAKAHTTAATSSNDSHPHHTTPEPHTRSAPLVFPFISFPNRRREKGEKVLTPMRLNRKHRSRFPAILPVTTAATTAVPLARTSSHAALSRWLLAASNHSKQTRVQWLFCFRSPHQPFAKGQVTRESRLQLIISPILAVGTMHAATATEGYCSRRLKRIYFSLMPGVVEATIRM